MSSDYKQWYFDNKSNYKVLLDRASYLIEILIRRERTVRFFKIESRIKDLRSFEAKMKRKQYANPEHMTDFAGLRIICYLLTDRKIISAMLQDNFEVFKTETKSNGYSAIHLDASLKQDRITLPEYEQLAGLKFEIQIVTILQHSWAEIEHNRRYKRDDDVLPPHLDQKFNSISETLVKCDNEFEQITREVDHYQSEQARKVNNHELDIPIDSPSLRQYLFKTFGDIPGFRPQYGSVTDRKVIDELHAMGIETLAGFEKIIPVSFKERYVKLLLSEARDTYATGIVRWILIIHDWKRYFDHVWVDDGRVYDEHDWAVFKEFGVDPAKFPDKVRWRWD